MERYVMFHDMAHTPLHMLAIDWHRRLLILAIIDKVGKSAGGAWRPVCGRWHPTPLSTTVQGCNVPVYKHSNTLLDVPAMIRDRRLCRMSTHGSVADVSENVCAIARGTLLDHTMVRGIDVVTSKHLPHTPLTHSSNHRMLLAFPSVVLCF